MKSAKLNLSGPKLTDQQKNSLEDDKKWQLLVTEGSKFDLNRIKIDFRSENEQF